MCPRAFSLRWTFTHMASWIRKPHGIATLVAIAVLATTTIGGLYLLKNGATPKARDDVSCGQVVNVLHYNAQPPTCLWQAYMRHQYARAIMVNVTPEGDPVTYTVTVSQTGVQVTVQSHDRFAPQGLFVYSCNGLSQQASVNGSGRIYLVATKCSGLQGYVDDDGNVLIP
jgi:hypothetical protein